jgi:hypothetical protein
MKLLLKAWVGIICGVLFIWGIVIGLIKLFAWLDSPCVFYVIHVVMFLAVTLLGACIVWGLCCDDYDD